MLTWITLQYAKYPPVCEMETIKFSLESPFSVSTAHCPMLDTYVICEAMCFAKGVQVTTVAEYLDNAGFYTKTPLQMDTMAAMLSLSLCRIILTYLCF